MLAPPARSVGGFFDQSNSRIHQRVKKLGLERLDISINLPPSAFQELAQIARHADKLPEIRQSASSIAPANNVNELSKRISETIGIDQSELKLVLGGLLSLNALLVRVRAKPEQLVELLTETLELQASPSWKDQYLKQWIEAKEKVAQALDWIGQDEVFVALRKMQQLRFAHQNILTDVRLINDLRPVYNTDGDKILHMMIYYSLLIDYVDGAGSHKIEFALDARDIRDLKRLCERAQKKTITATDAMKSQPWQTTVPSDTVEDQGEQEESTGGD